MPDGCDKSFLHFPSVSGIFLMVSHTYIIYIYIVMFITVEETKEILHHHHSDTTGGHSGVNNTLFKVSSFYHWNGMKEDIQEYVS